MTEKWFKFVISEDDLKEISKNPNLTMEFIEDRCEYPWYWPRFQIILI